MRCHTSDASTRRTLGFVEVEQLLVRAVPIGCEIVDNILALWWKHANYYFIIQGETCP